MDEASADKAALRKRFRAWRAALDEAEYARRSAALCAVLRSYAPLRAARTVAAFWPLVDRREPDLRPLLHALAALGVRVALPAVAPDGVSMVFRAMDGRWAEDGAGIAAPQGEIVPPGTLDVVVVPALAVARSGVRLGYGKGFYDRYLAGHALRTVVPIFDALFVGALPSDAHDVRVEAVATEHGITRLPLPTREP